MTTEEGLNFGKWTKEYELAFGKFSESGIYKIVSLSNYDTISTLDDHIVDIKYKGFKQMLFIYGRNGDSISVKDSIWQTVDSVGNLYKIDLWDNGLNLWTKYFDDKGNVCQYDYEDFEHDTSFYLTYKDNQLYKKAFYAPNNKNSETVIFYPNNNLIIPNAEPLFVSRYNDSLPNVFKLNLSCRKDLLITSIRSSSSNIHIDFPLTTLPYKLKKNATKTIDLIFTPTPSSLTDLDTITIQTSEPNISSYKIYCSLHYAHIDGRNVESIGNLSLSKTKDKYLLIAPMGTVTDAFIQNQNGEKKEYRIRKNTKIDLTDLSIGDYYLSIYSCDNGGQIRLKITE